MCPMPRPGEAVRFVPVSAGAIKGMEFHTETELDVKELGGKIKLVVIVRSFVLNDRFYGAAIVGMNKAPAEAAPFFEAVCPPQRWT